MELAALAKAEEEVNSLRLSVQRAAQPTAYLVSKLRDEEMRRAKAEGDLKEARQLVRLAEEREGQYRQGKFESIPSQWIVVCRC